MRRIGLWQVRDDGPQKLKASGIELERYLEDWIERDPGLLQQGLCIVGRQMGVEAVGWICWASTRRGGGP